jgi:hypothetical protein
MKGKEPNQRPLEDCRDDANCFGYRPRRHRIMEVNRNQFFMAGVVILLLGLQLRAVEAFTLNRECSQFLATRLPQKGNSGPATTTLTSFTAAASPAPLRTVRPPRWLGYALLSVGSVLILHSLAMKRPD